MQYLLFEIWMQLMVWLNRTNLLFSSPKDPAILPSASCLYSWLPCLTCLFGNKNNNITKREYFMTENMTRVEQTQMRKYRRRQFQRICDNSILIYNLFVPQIKGPEIQNFPNQSFLLNIKKIIKKYNVIINWILSNFIAIHCYAILYYAIYFFTILCYAIHFILYFLTKLWNCLKYQFF